MVDGGGYKRWHEHPQVQQRAREPEAHLAHMKRTRSRRDGEWSASSSVIVVKFSASSNSFDGMRRWRSAAYMAINASGFKLLGVVGNFRADLGARGGEPFHSGVTKNHGLT